MHRGPLRTPRQALLLYPFKQVTLPSSDHRSGSHRPASALVDPLDAQPPSLAEQTGCKCPLHLFWAPFIWSAWMLLIQKTITKSHTVQFPGTDSPCCVTAIFCCPLSDFSQMEGKAGQPFWSRKSLVVRCGGGLPLRVSITLVWFMLAIMSVSLATQSHKEEQKLPPNDHWIPKILTVSG